MRRPLSARRLVAAAALALVSPLAAQESQLTGPPPPPPDDITATPVSSTRIDLEWSPVEDRSDDEEVIGYRVYRDDVFLAFTDDEDYEDQGLGASTTYSYRVSSVDERDREGERSGAVAAATFPDDTPPPAPQGLVATAVGPNEIDLAWSAVVDPESGIAEYRIYRDDAFLAATTSTSYSDGGLLPLTTYRYHVSAVNGEGMEGAQSAQAQATTPLLPDLTPPTAPGGLVAAAVGARRIDLSWSAAQDPESGVASYRIYRDGVFLSGTTGTTYSDTDVQPETTYGYRVSAVNGEGLEGPESAEAQATTPAEADATPPTAPGTPVAVPTAPNRVDLAWSAAADPESGIAAYRVYRDGTFLAETPATTYADTDVQPSTTYRYRVSAVNGDGLEGPQSGEAQATTPPGPDVTPPTEPDGLEADAVSPTRVDLTWDEAEDPESGIAEYRLYRDGVEVGATTGTSFADTGLEPETRYGYRVTAVNGVGLEGPPSNEATATTPPAGDDSPPPAPGDLTATAASPTRVDLTWSPVDDPESGISEYRVYRDGARVGSTVTSGFSDTGLEPETRYLYRVTAVNGDGVEGPPSDQAEAFTPAAADTVPPAPPTGLRVVP